MSTKTDDQLQADLDALDDLTRHPGWLLVLQRAQARYGAVAFAMTMAGIALHDHAEAIALKLREAVGERNAALDLTLLPEREAKTLRAEQAKRRVAPRGRPTLGEGVEETV
jgi:hypothetical protein